MENLRITGCGMTDKGRVRPNNEDYYAIEDDLFIIADGMGGHNAGEIASKLTVQSILTNTKEFFQSNTFNNNPSPDYKFLIEKMIKNANQKVLYKSKKEPRFNKMGTTVVLALFQKPNMLHIANVGDSRAYLFRNNQLSMISEDHTLAKVMINEFNLNNEDFKNNNYKNYLTKAIGSNSSITPYYTSLTIIPEDKIILCSDGLWNMVEEKEIINILQINKSDLFKCNTLIEKANEYGGMDNITVIIISILS